MSCLLARWLYSLPAGALRVRAHAYFLLLFAPCWSPLGMFVAGKAGWESLCPLGKILTYKNLIYLLNFPFYCVNISYLVDRCRITTHWMEGAAKLNRDSCQNSGPPAQGLGILPIPYTIVGSPPPPLFCRVPSHLG